MTRALLLLVLFAAAGCKSVDSVIEANRAVAEKKLATLDAIHKAAPGLAPVSEAKVTKLDPPPNFQVDHTGKREPGWNAAMVFVADLADLKGNAENGMNITYDQFWFSGSASLVRKGVWVNGRKLEYVKTAEDCLGELSRLRSLPSLFGGKKRIENAVDYIDLL